MASARQTREENLCRATLRGGGETEGYMLFFVDEHLSLSGIRDPLSSNTFRANGVPRSRSKTSFRGMIVLVT